MISPWYFAIIERFIRKIKHKNSMKKLFSSLMLGLMATVAFASTAFAVDSVMPSDVDDFTGVAQNGAVKLSWSAATDDTGVTGYKVYYGLTSVTKKGETYDKNVDVGNVLTYTVSGLENGKKYYFSVIAYDAAANESAGWATEVSVTPDAAAQAGADKEAPQVASAEALDKEEVKVVFSEEIVLTAKDPQDSFSIENDETFDELKVLKAEMDTEDKTNKTVILTTDPQTDKTKYKLTVDISIKDKAGNPIISGTSDTAEFTGSGKDKPAGDTGGPELKKVEGVDSTHILVTFSEAVVLTIDPSEDFVIVGKTDATKKLDVLGVKLGPNSDGVEDASAVITTSEQAAIEYTVTIQKMKDETGNEVNAAKSSGTFTGVAKDSTPGKDTVAPKDVANFLAEAVVTAQKYTVTLTWNINEETKADLNEQLVYMSTDKGAKYDKKASLAADAKQYQIKGLSPGEYWFKVTQKDVAGNESAGSVTKVILAETGPEMLGLLALSVGLGSVFGKKRKK